ncbi:MAG: glycosyltransferase family 4 protein [Rhodospirillaceae bacterium]
MNILMVAAVDPVEPNASVLHISSLAEAFAVAGHHVEVVLPAPPQGMKPAISGESGYSLWFCSYSAMLRMPRVLSPILFAPMIVWHAWCTRVDLIYVRSATMTWFLTLLCRLMTRAFVITEHNGWIHDEIISLTASGATVARCASLFQTIDAGASHGVRAVTAGLAEVLAEKGVNRNRISVIGNGTNIHRFFPMARTVALAKRSLPDDAFYLGFIGNLAPWQGVDLVIEALPAIRAIHPAVRLIIAGSGPELTKLKEKAAALGIAEAVIFFGSVPLSEANMVVNCFDLAVAPFTTGRNCRIGLSPLKIRDYAAAGRAILAADIAGISTLDREPWLALFAPESVADFASRAIELIRDPDHLTRLGLAARRHAEQEFDWSCIAAKILLMLRPKMSD